MAEEIFVSNLENAKLIVTESLGPELSFEQQAAQDLLKARIAAAKENGMDRVAKALERELSEPDRQCKAQAKQEAKEQLIREIGAQLLSREEWQLWRQWLPTAYSSNSLKQNSFKDYAFDRPSLGILELIAKVKKLEVFDRLTIRTPEKQMSDPTLFGHLDDKVYLLARWGESDEKLLNLEQIKVGLKTRVWSDVLHRAGICITSLCVYVVATAGVFGSSKSSVSVELLRAIFGAGTSFGVLLMLSAYLVRRKFRYAF